MTYYDSIGFIVWIYFWILFACTVQDMVPLQIEFIKEYAFIFIKINITSMAYYYAEVLNIRHCTQIRNKMIGIHFEMGVNLLFF